MRKKLTIRSVLLAGGLLLGGQAISAPTAEMLGYTCAGCHGTNGASNGPAIPNLAGLSKEYLVSAMQSYRAGEREATIMTRIAKGYSDEEFGLMGDFFSAQKVNMITGQKYDAAKAAAGEKLHDKYCAKCHDAGGTVPDDEAGQLLGNTGLFMKYSLEDFHDKTRDSGIPKKMKKKLKKMMKKDKDAVDKLVNYYSSAK